MTDPRARKKISHRPARKARRHVWFEATAQRDHVHMQMNIPTKWLRLLVKILVVILIAFLILKMPEVWRAIQMAINTLPK